MGLPSNKLEFPPLLAVGFHDFSLEKLRQVCVDCFSASTTRSFIAEEFTKLVDELTAVKVPCELWLDGSYFTEKIDPEDIDFIVRIRGEVVDAATPEQLAVLNLLNSDLTARRCHSFVHLEWDSSDSRHSFGEWMKAYWLRQWGFARDERTMKGIAVMKFEGGV